MYGSENEARYGTMKKYRLKRMYLRWKDRWKTKKSLMVGEAIVIVFVLCAIVVPIVSKYSYSEQHVSMQNLSTSMEHIFGTDKFGRDLFVRVWFGARISMIVGGLSTVINFMIGCIVGSSAGYAGGRADTIIMQLCDMMVSIPSMLYVIFIILIWGATPWSIIGGICIAGWIPLARVVRGEVLRLKEMEFCLAAKVSGAGSIRILWKHLLVNASGPIIINTTFMIPTAIFTESFLSFVGVGISAPMASLGTLIQEARSQIQVYPMQLIYPMVVLCVLIIGLNLIGHGVEQQMSYGKNKI